MQQFWKFIKRKLGRGFTFLVVPNSSGANTKSITIPFSLVFVVLAIVIFNITIFIGFIIQTGTIYDKNQKLFQTRLENRKLHKEQREVKPTLRKSYQIVEELNRLKRDRIRINTTWKAIQQKGGRVITQASRGALIRFTPYVVPPKQEKGETIKTSLEVLKYNLSQINGYINEEKESQQQLLNELTAYEKLLDHTPSKWPVFSTISSWFGWRLHPVLRTYKGHEGVDLIAAYGTKVHASADGVVTYAGWDGGYGYLVKISHGYGYETRYGHNSKLLVYVGQAVKKSQVISLSGNTGVTTGPHLHYEVRINGEPVNPVPFLRN